MQFKFIPHPGFDFLTSFGEQFHVPIIQDRLVIPSFIGKGSIRRFNLTHHIKLVLHHYTLKENFVINRIGTKVPSGLVSIIFHGNEEPASLSTGNKKNLLSRNSVFAIQIASTDLNSVISFPANAEIYFAVIGIQAEALKELLAVEKPNSVLQTILNTTSGFLFYESMSVDIQNKLKQLTTIDENSTLHSFQYSIKVQELLYLVFEKLQKRNIVKHSPINKADSDALFLLRTAILSDLSMPPRLASLAKLAAMSETKMKLLFKQVFGESIYNYYQKARMEEAAFLLKHGGHSVSEVGFRLGFTNLSHFSKAFEKFYQLNPKKYSIAG